MSENYTPLVSRETIVSIVFGYLALGALIWLLLDRFGVIAKNFRARKARGASASALDFTLASLCVVLGWPIVVARYVRRICA